MSKYLCANIDKEEYLDFGDYPDNILEGSPPCNTLEYLLATEWTGDKIMFIYEENEKSNVFLVAKNDYDFVTEKYSERCVLNRVPKYKYIVNTDKHEYYFSDALPVFKTNQSVSPLPFILSEKENSVLFDTVENKEKDDIGRWSNDKVFVTNNKDACDGYKLFESPYLNVSTLPAPLSGLKIVVTGTISGFSRADIEEYISDMGGEPQNSVTKKTDMLVVGDYKPGTKKLADAKKYGVRTVTEQEFFDMIGE